VIEKVLKINLLYDFYGQMLTEKQRNVIELYYYDDLSLGEISEKLGISRQGVHDILKRSEKTLCYYEEKLSLVSKFAVQRAKLEEACTILDVVESSDQIESVKSLLHEILDFNL
jgi:predicted DNA-binding protein YlxM (UPF0122 family)